MTRERAKELLPIIQAYAEGKEVQISYDDGRVFITPANASDIEFNTRFIYRIKPEPREFWVNVYPDGSIGIFRTPENARVSRDISARPDLIETIHVREVL